jgi:acyl dehydratase
VGGPTTQTLITIGEMIARTIRYSHDDIAAFARLSFDENPLHIDAVAAQRARFGEIIASGQQTAAILMGMLATHFSRCDDGVARQMICLNMNFAFKVPVFAEQDVKLRWRVASVEWNQTLGGMLGQLDGRATVVPGKPSVIARGTILVSEDRAHAAPPSVPLAAGQEGAR